MSALRAEITLQSRFTFFRFFSSMQRILYYVAIASAMLLLQ